MDAAVLRSSDILEKEIIGGPVTVEIRGSHRPLVYRMHNEILYKQRIGDSLFDAKGLAEDRPAAGSATLARVSLSWTARATNLTRAGRRLTLLRNRSTDSLESIEWHWADTRSCQKVKAIDVFGMGRQKNPSRFGSGRG
jgi:hypothetical protein